MSSVVDDVTGAYLLRSDAGTVLGDVAVAAKLIEQRRAADAADVARFRRHVARVALRVRVLLDVLVPVQSIIAFHQSTQSNSHLISI